MAPQEELPQQNKYLIIGAIAGLVALCLICAGVGAFGYYNNPFGSDDQGVLIETTPITSVIEPTATSILDSAMTNEINRAVPDSPNSSTSEESTQTPTASPGVNAGRLIQLPDLAAVEYANFLMVDGTIFVLEAIAQQVETGQLSQEESDQLLLAVEATLDLIERGLLEPPPSEAPVSAVTAWSEATIALATIADLTRNWQTGEVTPLEASIALSSTHRQVDRMLTAAETSFEQQFGLNLGPVRQANTTETQNQLLDSIWSIFISEADIVENQVSTAAVPPVYRDDIPLSDHLSSSAAIRNANHILTMMQNFPDAFVKLNELKDRPVKPFVSDNSFRASVAEMGTVRASSRIIKDTELPTSLANLREILLMALIDCDNAAFHLAAGLSHKPEGFETGLAYLRQCNENLDQPRQTLEDFIKDQGGQPTSIPADAPENEPVTITAACPQGCVSLQPGCIIKGEVTPEGIKLYHLPGDPNYGDIQIDPTNGGRWFCTTQEALNNAWLSGVG